MRTKGNAYHALSSLFQNEGVPPVMVMDNAQEQSRGDFRRKLQQVDCRVTQVEPYTPQSNAAESSIRELKRGTARKMIKSQSPKVLWDYCLELESFIRSCTANTVFSNGGEVPETLVSGETADISPFAEFEWYEWVRFLDTSVSFPEAKETLGRYLGPALGVGPAMTARILKKNGRVVHRSTYRHLNDIERESEQGKKERNEFDEELKEKLGHPLTVEHLKEIDEGLVTPTFELYSDEEETHHHTTDIDDVTPEYMDQYVGAEVTLPKGNSSVTGRVRGRKRDADGNLSGKANPNPILDTRTYEVEFPDGEVNEYSANVIAENMWSQCDAEGNQYLLLDAIVDFRKDDHAVD